MCGSNYGRGTIYKIACVIAWCRVDIGDALGRGLLAAHSPAFVQRQIRMAGMIGWASDIAVMVTRESARKWDVAGPDRGPTMIAGMT
jgi:hypothetical protein